MSVYKTALYLFCLLVAAPAIAASPQPEPGSGWQAKQPAFGTRGMVAAAHPAAVRAGLAMLERGGSAIDAAIATQLALNVAEPQASGIGGGGFLLYYDAAAQQLFGYDGRETAPRTMPEDAFLDRRGQPLPFLEAVRGGRSVGAPGLLRMLDTAYRKHGKLPWKELFEPAIELAEHGVAVTPRLRRTIDYAAHLQGLPAFDQSFRQNDGSPLAVGEIRSNPALADSFRRIAEAGSDIFYSGSLAREIAAAVQIAPAHPGYLSTDDLARYELRRPAPLCLPYRLYLICASGPPSSGLTVLQALGILAHFDISSPSAASFHLLLEAEKLAMADRERYLADPAFVPIPASALLSSDYLAQRAALIDQKAAMRQALPGKADPQSRNLLLPAPAAERPSTTHISVVDAEGNAVALTSSIEHSFGSGLAAGGFLLNNQLTDFSFVPRDTTGELLPNRIEPGKRPRSAMSPTLVFDKEGRLRLVIGSPGGVRIIPYVVQALVAVLDWGLPLQEALDTPHVLSLNGPAELEEGQGLESLGKQLEAYGHKVVFKPLNSGLHAVHIRADGTLIGAADPRRDGVAQGY